MNVHVVFMDQTRGDVYANSIPLADAFSVIPRVGELVTFDSLGYLVTVIDREYLYDIKTKEITDMYFYIHLASQNIYQGKMTEEES